MTETEESWAERVRAWRASGLSAERFADGKGYAGSTLRYRASKAAKASVRSPKPGLMLRRLVRAEAAPSSSALLVQIGGASITVAGGFDPELLRAVARCLAGASE